MLFIAILIYTQLLCLKLIVRFRSTFSTKRMEYKAFQSKIYRQSGRIKVFSLYINLVFHIISSRILYKKFCYHCRNTKFSFFKACLVKKEDTMWCLEYRNQILNAFELFTRYCEHHQCTFKKQ